jgi:CRP-like cAMP-binding protein
VPKPRPSSSPSTEDEALLRKFRLFSSIPAAVRNTLLRSGAIRSFRKGEVVWRRGQSAKLVYVILVGRIGLFDTMITEGSTVIDLFSPGSIVGGGFPLLEPPHTYLFSGKALDELRVLTIPIPVYRQHMENHALLIATARHLLGAWQRLVTQMRDLKELSADQRLASYLLALTDRKSGSTTLQLSDDQLLIAALLGVTRESLSRSFAHLREQGVSKRGRTVVLADIRRLQRFAR